MLSYKPLFDFINKNHISTYYLLQHGIDNRTLHNLKHNQNITMLTAEKYAIFLIVLFLTSLYSLRNNRYSPPSLLKFPFLICYNPKYSGIAEIVQQ